VKEKVAVDSSTLLAAWTRDVKDVFARATLKLPADVYMQRGGRTGNHTEHLGVMLAEMQVLPRTHPGAKW
jgi:ring-1,2-phenylacetyl-CoA epoxidase subunit PaaC